MKTKLIQTKDHLLLIDEEAEIKETDYVFDIPKNIFFRVKSFGQNGGKTLIEETLDYSTPYEVSISNCKKCLAYYPLAKETKELNLPLLPNPFEVTDIWKLGNHISVTTIFEYEESQAWPNHKEYINKGYQTYIGEVIEVDKGLALKTECGKIFKTQGSYWFGSVLKQKCSLIKAAQPKQFSLEDVKKAIEMAREIRYSTEEIIQSLSTQQLPKEFIPEYESDFNSCYCTRDICNGNNCPKKLKTITNSEGKEELVGTYKY